MGLFWMNAREVGRFGSDSADVGTPIRIWESRSHLAGDDFAPHICRPCSSSTACAPHICKPRVDRTCRAMGPF